MTDNYTSDGTAICEHESPACSTTVLHGANIVSAYGINVSDLTSCPLTLTLHTGAYLDGWKAADLVYSVQDIGGQALTLDGASVEWVARDYADTVITTKSTDDYSIITFGNTLVVHLFIHEVFETLTYTATITTTDNNVYTITGLLFVGGFGPVVRIQAAMPQNPRIPGGIPLDPRIDGAMPVDGARIEGTTPQLDIRVEGIKPVLEVRLEGLLDWEEY